MDNRIDTQVLKRLENGAVIINTNGQYSPHTMNWAKNEGLDIIETQIGGSYSDVLIKNGLVYKFLSSDYNYDFQDIETDDWLPAHKGEFSPTLGITVESDMYALQHFEENPFFPKLITSVASEMGLTVIVEEIKGKALSEMIDEGTFSEKDLSSFYNWALQMTSFCLLRGFIPMDVTPWNIIVSEDGFKCIDLGLFIKYDTLKNMEEEYVEEFLSDGGIGIAKKICDYVKDRIDRVQKRRLAA